MSDQALRRSRRRVLRGALALAGAGAAAALPGCAAQRAAPQGAQRAAPRVLVVGGGFGGATAAHYLKHWGGDAVQVQLLERESRYVACPLSNLVAAGVRGAGALQELTLGYDGLRRAGVEVTPATVTGIDTAARRVRLHDGRDLAYDRLLLAPGIDFMADAVAGLPEALESGRIVHAWKAGAQTLALRRQIEALPAGGVFALTIPKAPYRCPPGPYERACLVAAVLKAQRPRAKVLVLDANAEIQSKKALFERAFAGPYRQLIEYRSDAELQAVDGRVARLIGDDVRADVLNVIPPQRAGAVAQMAGVVNANGRWARVDWQTMESTAVPGVHVVGDAVLAGPGMPKSAHMANQHAKIAAAAIVQALAGQPPNDAPMAVNTCYSFFTPDEAAHVASVHRWEAAERQLKPVPGAGGLSAAPSAAEARLAQAWADNLFADSFAL